MESDPTPIAIESLLQHSAWVRRLARCLVADPAGADDLEQQTWLTALTRAPRHAQSLRGWLGAVIRSLARRRARSLERRQRREASVLPPPTPLDPESALIRAELQRRVVDAVQSLAPIYRTAIVLRFIEERSIEEMAGALSLPSETVRTRVKRALEQLRARLACELGDDDRDWRRALAPLLLEGGRVLLHRSAVAVAALLLAVAGIAVWLDTATGDDARVALRPDPDEARRDDGVAEEASLENAERGVASRRAFDRASERTAVAPLTPSVSGWVAPWWRTTGAERIAGAIVLAAPWGARDWTPIESYVARVRALAKADETGRGEVRRVVADELGRFAFEALDSSLRWSFVAVDPQLGLGAAREIAVTAGSAVTQVELYTQRSQVFEGIVVDDEGAPVAGARLEWAPNFGNDSMSSVGLSLALDEASRFVVELPAYRWVRFKATAPGLMQAICTIHAREAKLHPQPVELRLHPARRIAGRFVARDGFPFSIDEALLGRLSTVESTLDSLDGVAVVALAGDPDFRVGAIVDEVVESLGVIDVAQNAFVVDVTEDSPSVALVARRTIVGWVEWPRPRSLVEEDAQTDLLVDGRLLPSFVGDASLRVRVLDERGQPLAVLPDSLELLDLHFNSSPLLDRCDASAADRGEVTWPSLPLGDWSIGARLEGRLASTQLVQLDRKGEMHDVELHLPRPMATLRCTVVDVGGKPLVDARDRKRTGKLGDPLEPRIYRSTEEGWQPAASLPDETADRSATTATLRVAPGRYVVVVDPPRLIEGERRGPAWSIIEVLGERAEVTIELRASKLLPLEVVALPEVELPIEPIGLQLRVLTLDGIPLVDETGPESQSGRLGTKVRTGLPAGRYRVVLHLPRHEPAEQVVDLPATERVELPLRFSRR